MGGWMKQPSSAGQWHGAPREPESGTGKPFESHKIVVSPCNSAPIRTQTGRRLRLVGRNDMHYISHYMSPIGGILLAADEMGLTGLWFEGQKYFAYKLEDRRE